MSSAKSAWTGQVGTFSATLTAAWVTQELLITPDEEMETCTVSFTLDHETPEETVDAKMDEKISDVVRRLAALVGHTISDIGHVLQMAEAPSHQGLTVAQVVEIADGVFDFDEVRHAGCWYQLASEQAEKVEKAVKAVKAEVNAGVKAPTSTDAQTKNEVAHKSPPLKAKRPPPPKKEKATKPAGEEGESPAKHANHSVGRGQA